jgi:hypothetical protein
VRLLAEQIVSIRAGAHLPVCRGIAEVAAGILRAFSLTDHRGHVQELFVSPDPEVDRMFWAAVIALAILLYVFRVG